MEPITQEQFDNLRNLILNANPKKIEKEPSYSEHIYRLILGDFEIEVLLNEEGNFSMKFFNRENDIRNFGEQIGYTQGMGISYNVEFDNFRELLAKIFKGNKKSNEEDKKNVENEDENALPEYLNFKKKDTLKQ